MRRISFVLFLAALVAGPIQATQVQRPGHDLVDLRIEGTITFENGESLRFTLPSGQALLIKSGTKNLSLLPVVETDAVVFHLLEDGGSQITKALDSLRLDLGQDGYLLAGSGLNVRLDGMTQSVRKAAVGLPENVAACNSCTVNCGRLEVTCEVCNGWCCDMSCSSGGGCSVCSAIAE